MPGGEDGLRAVKAGSRVILASGPRGPEAAGGAQNIPLRAPEAATAAIKIAVQNGGSSAR